PNSSEQAVLILPMAFTVVVGLLTLLNDEVDEREFALVVNGVVARFDRIVDLRVLRDLHPETTERSGHGRKVRVFQLGTRNTARVVTFLVCTDGPILLVIHDNDQWGGSVLGRGRKFLTIHQELTIPRNSDDAFVRVVQ